MPITTPSTVRPARILFLASARRAIRMVTGEIMFVAARGLPDRTGGRGLDDNHKHVVVLDGSGRDFRELAVGQSGLHFDGAQQIAIGHPNVPPRPFLAKPGSFRDRE